MAKHKSNGTNGNGQAVKSQVNGRMAELSLPMPPDKPLIEHIIIFREALTYLEDHCRCLHSLLPQDVREDDACHGNIMEHIGKALEGLRSLILCPPVVDDTAEAYRQRMAELYDTDEYKPIDDLAAIALMMQVAYGQGVAAEQQSDRVAA